MREFPVTAAVFPYEPACLLRVAGPDAATFLQGQFSNDLRNLAPGGAVYGLWLDRKGHVVADSHVVAAPEGPGFWIASVACPARDIARHLEGHIVADDVAVEDVTGGWRGLALMGAGAGAWLSQGPRPGLCFPGRRGGGESWEWLFAAADAPAAAGAVAGARTMDAAEVERLRILSAVPRVPADIGPADLPQEGALDAQAVSYSKGCYTGQEVMSRLRTMGRVRRRLVRVRGPGAAPPVPAALWSGGRRQGELRSAAPDAEGAGYWGLALLAAAAASGAAPLSLAADGPPALEVAGDP